MVAGAPVDCRGEENATTPIWAAERGDTDESSWEPNWTCKRLDWVDVCV